MSDVATQKIHSIQRCVQRAREEFHAASSDFETNFTRQDAALLNVLRACEQSIDLANHVIKSYKMGIPATSGESFDLLAKTGVINMDLSNNLRKMVHFRNLVIHRYQSMNLEIVKAAIMQGLDDLIEFCDRVLAHLANNPI